MKRTEYNCEKYRVPKFRLQVVYRDYRPHYFGISQQRFPIYYLLVAF